MRCTRKHRDEIEKRIHGDDPVFVLSDAMHTFTISNGIGGSVHLPVLHDNVLPVECAKVNMLGWINIQRTLWVAI